MSKPKRRDDGQVAVVETMDSACAIHGLVPYSTIERELADCQRERDKAQRIAINKDSDLDAAKLERAQMKEAWQEGIAALKAELAEANAVLRNPEKWHKWCDIRVLEQFEAARDEEARECLRVCQDEQLSTPVPEFMGVARAKYNEGISRCIGAIERRIAKREKA